MRVKLLKKARKELVILQDKKSKLYRLRHSGYQPAGAAEYAYRYNSGWIIDLERIRKYKREQTLILAKQIFSSYSFKYVRNNFKVIN